jgi:hypothetical protein
MSNPTIVPTIAQIPDSVLYNFKFHNSDVKPVLTMAANGNIIFNIEGEEYLRITQEGFFVRGEQVAADSKEAEQVYKAFRQWLVWAHLVNPS